MRPANFCPGQVFLHLSVTTCQKRFCLNTIEIRTLFKLFDLLETAMHFTSAARSALRCSMLCRLLMRTTIYSLVVSMAPAMPISSQQPSSTSAPASALPSQESTNSVALVSNGTQVSVPIGTRLPLLLRNGINTRTAKAGDSVYFETAYPIARNNRIVIPMGSFVRGQILEAKRPGRIRGRGEFRIALEQMTLSNGYTIELRATPSSVDRDGKEGVTPEGVVTGPGVVDKDVNTVLFSTATLSPNATSVRSPNAVLRVVDPSLSACNGSGLKRSQSTLTRYSLIHS